MVVAAIVAVGGFFVSKKLYFRGAVIDREKAGLPTAIAQELRIKNKESSKTPDTKVANPTVKPIPDELNLDVPFTSQAPNANWDYTHEEACEEAAILMANRYFEKRKIENSEDAEKGLQEIIAWEKENLGFFESTTAQETVRVFEEMLNLETETIENPTVEQIKQAIADDKLVIVPAAGRELGNPFYKSPGPLYHMLLIKGYTKTQFITNDAGTKRGENYPYDFKTVLNANHDWNGGNVANGVRNMIIVGRK